MLPAFLQQLYPKDNNINIGCNRKAADFTISSVCCSVIIGKATGRFSITNLLFTL